MVAGEDTVEALDGPEVETPGAGRTFEAWYETAWPELVTGLTATIGDREAAIDAAAEACVRAHERWDRVAAITSPTGWTYTVGLNVARRTLRLRRRRSDPRLGPTPSIPGPDPAGTEFVRALQNLSDRQRQVLVLRYVFDLTQARVGEVLSIAPGTVAATLHQARARFRQLHEETDR